MMHRFLSSTWDFFKDIWIPLVLLVAAMIGVFSCASFVTLRENEKNIKDFEQACVFTGGAVQTIPGWHGEEVHQCIKDGQVIKEMAE